MQAKAAGQAFADAFHRLSKEEQREVILRTVAGTLRSNARRAGHPEPIIMDCRMDKLPGGGYVLVEGSLVALSAEWGGDSRTVETAGPGQPDPAGARAKAKEIQAALAMTGPKGKARAR